MSTKHSNVLWLRPYAEIDRTVPDCGIKAMLPGRLAAVTHPLNKGRKVLLADREWYDPDVCVVVASGIPGYEPGEVVVLQADHGAYYPKMSPDGREVRMIGVIRPWYETIVAKWTEDGLEPTPGYALVERERCGAVQKASLIEVSVKPKRAWNTSGTVLRGEHSGERIVWDPMAGWWTFEGCLPNSQALVRCADNLAPYQRCA